MGSRTVGVGILGSGWMGRAHASAYRRFSEVWPEHALTPDVVHVADSDAAFAEALAARCGAARWSTDWKAVVDDPAVEIVHVTAPHHLHAPMMIAAADAGRHVACEKPMGLDVFEARAIVAAVERAGVVSQVGYHHRLLPPIAHARRLVEDGYFGDVRHIVGEFTTDPGWQAMAPFSWRYDRDQAGWGALSDLGSHVIDIVSFLGGRITRVAGVLKTFVSERPTGDGMRAVTNDDFFAAIAEIEGGTVCVLYGSRVATGGRAAMRISLDGSRAAFGWDLERMNEFTLSTPAEDGDYGVKRVVAGPDHPGYAGFSPAAGLGLGWHDGKVLEARELLDAIAAERRSRLDAAVGLEVMSVLDAVDRASQTRGWVEVDRDGDTSADV